MGTPMARNLHRVGYLAAIWNRTGAKARRLGEEFGVPVAADPADLARRCELVILSLSSDADVLEVIAALQGGLRAGSVLVDTSTVSRDTARAAAVRLEPLQVTVLDCPVSGGVEGARKGTLAMMAGGDAAALERIRPVLQAIAGRVEHMGPVGAGQATKAVNQLVAAGINQAVSEGLAFARALDLPLEKVIDIVGSGAAGNWFITHRGPSMARDAFTAGFRLALHHKDLAICKQMAAELGVALPLVEMTLIHYRRLMRAGFGDEDISALYREKQALFDKAGKMPRPP
jgi:3-hydroxyisobutyrate dehydrogenase